MDESFGKGHLGQRSPEKMTISARCAKLYVEVQLGGYSSNCI
jgi:hypothetical protein